MSPAAPAPPGAEPAGGTPRGALDSVLVADFSRVLAGPYATMLLGDLGADVVKVERPGAGDDTRHWGPPFVDGESAYYLSVNRNKRSVAWDLGTPEGLAAARDLARRADVLVENFRPGTMDRLGLGYDAVRAANPGIVYCSLSGFGSGAGADLPGYDFLVQGVGGLMSVTGEPGHPTKVGVALVDVLAGTHLAVAALAALHARRATGEGQRVEVDLLSTLLSSLVNQASTYVQTGVAPRAMGNAHPSIAPYETLATGGGLLVVAVGNDRQFARMAAVLGREDLAHDDRFATNPARVQHRRVLVGQLQDALATAPAAAWTVRLMAAGVPCGVVNDLGGAFALAADLGLEPVVELARADGTPVRQVASPLRLSGTPVTYRHAPPRLGEDTATATVSDPRP